MSSSASGPLASWPKVLREVAEVVGREAAQRLATECGGVAVTVPREVKLEHPWCLAVGRETFAKLVAAFGGRRLNLPRGTFAASGGRTDEVLELHARGATAAATALKLGLTERHVRRILARARTGST